MSILAAPAACYADAPDVSLGAQGWELRAFIRAATARPSDRHEEVLLRVVSALQKAEARDGMLVAAETFHRTLNLLGSLSSRVALPRVVIESETEIGLDWDLGDSAVLSLTVDSTPMVGYAAVLADDAHHGRFRFVEGTPAALQFLLDRVFAHSRA